MLSRTESYSELQVLSILVQSLSKVSIAFIPILQLDMTSSDFHYYAAVLGRSRGWTHKPHATVSFNQQTAGHLYCIPKDVHIVMQAQLLLLSLRHLLRCRLVKSHCVISMVSAKFWRVPEEYSRLAVCFKAAHNSYLVTFSKMKD